MFFFTLPVLFKTFVWLVFTRGENSKTTRPPIISSAQKKKLKGSCAVNVSARHWAPPPLRGASWMVHLAFFPTWFNFFYKLRGRITSSHDLWCWQLKHESCLIFRDVPNGAGCVSIRGHLLQITFCGSHFLGNSSSRLPKLIFSPLNS